MGSKPVRSDFRFLTSVPCPWQAWQRPTLPSLRDLVPLAQESLTAEFGMGSGLGSPLQPPGRRRTGIGKSEVRKRLTAASMQAGSRHQKSEAASEVHPFRFPHSELLIPEMGID